ncbi:AraC family transcriptional regulator [Microvirga thermotolerans]|uniref:AraC family transcriptional regulator n=1 Tax=Microvirga thermotolerans TaxID=2651334 RepID=A0A5P9JZG1_9HYPH|nr:AraC family transcriptional regulator [Microvirga thermotolerans]QFU17118.1 AraC family transcriptional regulator [Microvirga thermotolerans]
MTVLSPEHSLDPEQRAAGDVTHFWRVPRHRGLECLRATFRRHAYARHSHETYAIAAVLSGCETFFYRGEQHYAGPGTVAVVCPDEIHDGEPYGGGFEYRTFYPSVELIREIAEEVAGRPLANPPWFPHAVMHDPELARAHAQLHACLCHDEVRISELEQDARLVAYLAQLIARWANLDAPAPLRYGTRGIARVRDYLESHLASEADLASLAAMAGLSRSHFIRAFQRETGLTPHAYLLDRRFRAARRLLERGEAPGEVAAACGFFDQSHLNRVFKARMGITPGAYRAA